MHNKKTPPSELSPFIIDQDYFSYSDEDQHVWYQVITNKEDFIRKYKNNIDPTYLSGFYKINLKPEKIPTLAEINVILQTVGWMAVCVDGYLPSAVYANFIEHKIFPVARHIRRLKHIDHSPIPDFIHDVTGHLPMLFSMNYQDFLQKIILLMNKAPGNELDELLFNAHVELGNLKHSLKGSAASLSAIQKKIETLQSELKRTPSILTQLTRMFLWSIEFGLIGDKENYKCFGAGILTAPTEVLDAINHRNKIIPYSIDVINYEINFSDIQDQFFVTKSYDHLTEVLDQYLAAIERSHPELTTAFCDALNHPA